MHRNVKHPDLSTHPAFPRRAATIHLRILATWLGLLVAGLAWGSVCVAASEDPTADPRPNIVFLLIDDMGWPDLACYGHGFHETPNIDRLCAQGLKFTDFYAATPVCSSTRSTIQTGQYSARTGITDFIPGHWRPFEKLVVPPIEDTLADGVRTPGDVLQAAGYATGYFGKWHLGPENTHGPDRYGYQVTAKTLGDDFKAWRKTKEAGPKRIDLLTDQTLWFIQQHQQEPFFVTLSHHAVHIPVEAEPETIAKYREKPKPAAGVNHPVYAAMTEDLDRSVGRILDQLKQLQLDQRTVVVFTSDNGGLRKTYTGAGDVISTNAPLRDEKGTLYEGGIRVPMIVRWPRVVEAGTVTHQPATTADLLPTFCELVGAELPEQPIDGCSLLPLLTGQADGLDREAIYFHYPHYHHSRPAGALRQGDWKLVEFFDGSPAELYNLREDLGETRNLAAQEPERTEAMLRALSQWRKSVGARMPATNPDYDPDRADEWWSRRTNQPLKPVAKRQRTSGPAGGT